MALACVLGNFLTGPFGKKKIILGNAHARNMESFVILAFSLTEKWERPGTRLAARMNSLRGAYCSCYKQPDME
jgi:hypothetical protein